MTFCQQYNEHDKHHNNTATLLQSGSSHPSRMQLHADHPQSSRGSRHVTCPSVFHRSASQDRCHNCVHSSGLSAALIPSPRLISRPHEWSPRGVDDGEVMSPIQETPAAQLDNSAETSASTTGCMFLDRTRVLPAHSLASPSSTWPSPVEGRGSQGQWRAPRRTDHIEVKKVS